MAERCAVIVQREGERRVQPVGAGGPAVPGWIGSIDSQRPVVIADAERLAEHEPAWAEWLATGPVRSIAALPLHAGGRFIGFLVADSSRRPVSFPADEIDFLTRVAAQLGLLIETAGLQEKLRREATTDSLTRLRNRRYVEERLAEEINRSQRAKQPMVVLLVDVDALKQINDSAGHLAGDAVLLRIAEALRGSTRVSDIVGRIAGDEFLVILPATTRETAQVMVDRLMSRLLEEPVQGLRAGAAAACQRWHGPVP